MRLRFHWSLSQVGDKFRRSRATTEMTGLLSLDEQADFCRRAEEFGIDSVLMAFGFTRPDPVTLSAALGMLTGKIKFMVACRTGIFSPTFFVQQINTISAINGGRVCINMVMGHSPDELHYYGDYLSHDERYARADEFLTVCRALWGRGGPVNHDGKYYRVEGARVNTPFVSDERDAPEIYLGGNSQLAEELALKHADCLWRFPDAPEKLRPRVEPLVARGTEVGLLVSIISRRTRDEALRASAAMLETVGAKSKELHREFARKSDSEGFRANFSLAESGESEWLTPYLWTGAIPYLGAPAIALVGSHEEIASAIMEYREAGITQFLFMGWPDMDEMTFFGREILPIVRRKEDEAEARRHSAEFVKTP
jgi:alkanesulfonate monooxygenase